MYVSVREAASSSPVTKNGFKTLSKETLHDACIVVRTALFDSFLSYNSAVSPFSLSAIRK
jgi:hypothetical protein